MREAVEGYRRVALEEALNGARTALTAAGIDCNVDDGEIGVPPEVEDVLAWAVREGTTNVVRHSDAAHCSIRVHRGESAEVEIEDDGSARRNGSNGGSGLIGLAERAQAIRGTVEAGSRPEGGFRLRVTVPLGEA